MTIFFTADLHLGHTAILKFAARPFDTIEEHDRAVIEAINERVGRTDTLYILGDFSLRFKDSEVQPYLDAIKCKKRYLVKGNHDKAKALFRPGAFAGVYDYREIKVQGRRLVMSHYPMLDWNYAPIHHGINYEHASIMLHGHIHSQTSAYNGDCARKGIWRYDVGLDANGLKPVSFEEICAFIAERDVRLGGDGMAIFITGDTHGSQDIGKLEDFYAEGLTRDDYVIVLGDFGLPWKSPESAEDARWLDWYESRPWTTLFIDGNHENFEALDAYPVADWHGGSVRVLRPHVLHLRRAEVFEIDGRTFFTFGGAHSVDKAFRMPFVSWWPQEVPDARVRQMADEKVAEVGEVDYVLTHCPPLEAFYDMRFVGPQDRPDELMRWLQDHVADKLRFKKWFYGHMHGDRPWDPRYIGLYDVVYDLDDTGRTGFSPSTDWGRFDSYPDW